MLVSLLISVALVPLSCEASRTLASRTLASGARDLGSEASHVEPTAAQSALAELGAGTTARTQWLFSSDPTPPGGCARGSHFELDRSRSDHHIINPNCRAGDSDTDCDEEEHHFVLTHSLEPRGVARGRCSEVVRGPSIFYPVKEIWDLGDTLGHHFLYGEIEVECENGRLTETDYSCRELLPFSVIFEHDPTPRTSVAPPLPWQGRRASAWGDAEVAFYDCGPVPPQLVLSETACIPALRTSFSGIGMETQEGDSSCFTQAAEDCENLPGCEAVALLAGRGFFQLLSAFACTPAKGTSSAGFEAGDSVRWRGVATEAPSTMTGTVEKAWDLQSPDDGVLVTWPGRRRAEPFPANKLEAVSPDSRLTQTVARKLRERKVFCDDLQKDYSCDVYKRSDALILFESNSATGTSVHDCKKACAKAAENSTLLTSCCAYHDASFASGKRGQKICALTRGEHFDLLVHEGEEGGERYPQKAYNAHPEAFEAAGRCYERSCADDPLCAIGGKQEFEAPPNATVPTGDVLLYFDFAHPLSAPFSVMRGDNHANIFHFTSNNPRANLKKKGRALRVVGSIPDNEDARAFTLAAGMTRQDSGFKPARADMDDVTLGTVQKRLSEVCQEHGLRVQRQLTAPRLDSETRDACMRKHGLNSLRFEPCMMRVGCKRVDPEEDLLPFHAPWFSQLPFDVIAWQQPAPMCCAEAYNIDMRDEHLRQVFFQKIGFQDPRKVSLHRVGNAGAKEMMSKSLHQGAKAMKHLLAYEVKDEPTVEWLAGFIVHASHGLNKFMLDLMDTVDSEGDDDVEMSADGDSFLQAHELGDLVAPSGRRAVEVARWSADRGAFLQVAARNGTWGISAAWNAAKRIPGAIYNYGLKPVWKHVMKPLGKWGLSISKWVLEHPRAALFISKIALQIRDRMCEKTSAFIYGQPETHAVGAFSKVSEKVDDFRDYMSSTFSPAVLLTGLQKALESSNFMARVRSLGSAAFGPVMAWAGVATGGAAAALIGGLASMMADAAIDASKMALEYMVYQEIAKEIPSNLYDMLMSKCLFQRENETRITLGATANEVQVAAREAVAQVSEQVAEQGANLLGSMRRFSSFFAGSGPGSALLEASSGNGTWRPEI